MIPRRSTAFAAAAALTLAACAPGQQPPTERQRSGAALGAVAGAALGLLAGGDDRRNALVGAGIGLLAGVAVGSYLDDREERLRRDLEGTGATVQRAGDAILITLPEGVTFDVDSSQVRQEFRRPLRRAARTLTEDPRSYVDVLGHADSTGSEAYNQGLSERRARAVAGVLTRNGVQEARVRARGFGESRPVASNDTASGRARNRRVEIVVRPATAEG